MAKPVAAVHRLQHHAAILSNRTEKAPEGPVLDQVEWRPFKLVKKTPLSHNTAR